MGEREVQEFLQSLDGVTADTGIRDGITGYRAGSDGKLFALVYNGTQPVRLGLKCDSTLARTLREKYETVMPSSDMDARSWNTVVCSGQLSEQEVKDLMRHAYEQVSPSGWF